MDSTINQNPWIALATPVFHPFLETTPTQLAILAYVQDIPDHEHKISGYSAWCKIEGGTQFI
jgi:hypothetical protein